MTLAYKGGSRITGTNADRTGGTWTNLPDGWIFSETDTNPPLNYLSVGGAWRLITERTVTETMTGKTLTAPVISTIVNTGTLTLPTSTDTLVGKATTDILTGKSLSEDQVTLSQRTPKFIRSPENRKGGGWYGERVGDGTGIWATVCTSALSGTATQVPTTDGTDGTYIQFTTQATINSVSGERTSLYTERDLNPYLKIYTRINSITAIRIALGFNGTAATPASGADPLPTKSGAVLWYDSAVNANWRYMTNNGAATSTNTDSTVAAATGLLTVEILGDNAGAGFKFALNGGAYSSTITGTAPAATTDLCAIFWIENTTAANQTINGLYMETEVDK